MTAYITVTDAQTFLDGELDTEPWDLSDDITRAKALEMASRLIDSLPLHPAYVFIDRTSSSVPQDFKDACVLIAVRLLENSSINERVEGLKLLSYQYDKIKATLNPDSPAEHILAGIPDIRAFRLLKPYLIQLSAIRLSRTS